MRGLPVCRIGGVEVGHGRSLRAVGTARLRLATADIEGARALPCRNRSGRPARRRGSASGGPASDVGVARRLDPGVSWPRRSAAVIRSAWPTVSMDALPGSPRKTAPSVEAFTMAASAALAALAAVGGDHAASPFRS